MSKSDEVRELLNVALKDIGILAHFKVDALAPEWMEAVECTLAALLTFERDRLLKAGPAPIPEVYGTA
jgi:hypothetical protein